MIDTFYILQNIFMDIFDNTNLKITKETTPLDIIEWDSLAQINIIIACEDTFKIKFIMEDIVKLKNVGDILNLIEKSLS